MLTKVKAKAPRLEILLRKDLDRIPQLQRMSADERLSMKAVAAVLPFRVNRYVVDELIDWERVPDDPMYQLTFPQPGMLEAEDLTRMRDLIAADADKRTVAIAARAIQQRMNPHPAGQMELNVPHLGDKALRGMQHKYRETVLFFPSAGQTCHTYCTYCFRWAQFVGIDELKFAAHQADTLAAYLREHKEVNSVLFTGGDPMVMRTSVLRRYIEPLLVPELDHINSIRIGTKAPAYWPHRFTSDADADDLLRLFEEVRRSGRHLALMAHFSHHRELETEVAQDAIRRIHASGAVVRCQAPLIRHVNDSADVWTRLWRRQVLLSAVPYYMFIERDTGPKGYFEVPLARAYEIFSEAYRRVSGLARTVRGPSMSATPGKVLVDGVTQIGDEKVFVLKMLQGRDPQWVNQVFFAKYDPTATWLDQLKPALGAREFFFDDALRQMKEAGVQPAWGEETRIRKRVSDFGHIEWE
jgi:KamA family protein